MEVDWCSRTHSHYPRLSKTHSNTLELLFFSLFLHVLCIGVQECHATHMLGAQTGCTQAKVHLVCKTQVAYCPNPLFDVYMKTGIFQPQQYSSAKGFVITK